MAKKKSTKSEPSRPEEGRTDSDKSKAAKQTKTQSAVSGLTFEEALEQLQGVVSTLENGKLTLSQSLDAYEKGVGLLKVCYGGLEDAEHRIRLLTGVDDDGRLSLSDFDGTSTAEQLQSGAGTRRSSQVAGSNADGAWSETSFQDSDSVDLDNELDDEELGEQESDEWEEGRLF